MIVLRLSNCCLAVVFHVLIGSVVDCPVLYCETFQRPFCVARRFNVPLVHDRARSFNVPFVLRDVSTSLQVIFTFARSPFPAASKISCSAKVRVRIRIRIRDRVKVRIMFNG